jgi:hypothetical protein
MTSQLTKLITDLLRHETYIFFFFFSSQTLPPFPLNLTPKNNILVIGKRKFDGGQTVGDSKRRYGTGLGNGGAWGTQPLPQQPLGNGSEWYTDTYPTWS